MPAALDPTDITKIHACYERDGFAVPINVMSKAEIAELRADLEAAERELADDPARLKLLYAYPDRLLPSFDAMTRNPRMVGPAAAILGPDLMVWSAALFIKEAGSQKIVSWHQDLTYWQLDDVQETTCWLAISDATVNSGCMKFVPGSHREQIVAHNDTFDDNNLLSRGQEIAVDVDESEAVAAEVLAGQASLHHGHLFHASGPNHSSDRRIGSAVRYIKPSMQQSTGDKPLVSLVAGEDRYGHFTIAGPPAGRLHEDDFARCARDAELKARLLFD